MNNNDLMNALSGLDQKYIDEAAYELKEMPDPGKSGKAVRKRTSMKRLLYFTIPGVAAAILAVAVALPVVIRTVSSGYAPMAASDAAEYPAPEEAMDSAADNEAAESAEAQSGYDTADSAEAQGGYEKAESAETQDGYEGADSAEAQSGYEAAESAEAQSGYDTAESAGEPIYESAEAAKAEDGSSDQASESAAGVPGFEKATYDEGRLIIEMKGTLPDDADDLEYMIISVDEKGRETVYARGTLKDILTKRDPLTLDIEALDLSEGTYTLTVGTESVEFTV